MDGALDGAHWRARRVGSRRAAAAPPSALRLRAHALLALPTYSAVNSPSRTLRGSGSGGDYGDSLLLSL